LRVTSATRLRRFWARHRTLFWWIHSAWALATGIAVLVFARERWGFVPWVVLFLGITWASTLIFGGAGSEDPEALPTARAEFASWLTRGMFQETLFFLLPFYAYSTVVGSWNVLLTGLLGALALFSCADLVFDRWLRTSAIFGMLFFATVSFAALNLLLPILAGLAPAVATPVAGGLSVLVAAPIAVRGRGSATRRGLFFAALGGAAVVGVTLFAPILVPPVPLRLDAVTFADDIDRATLELSGEFADRTAAADVGDRLVVLAQVFAPSALPAAVRIEWRRDGVAIRTTREIDIVAHGDGFRVWDAWLAEGEIVRPGVYEARLTTAGRIFGIARIEVDP